MQQILEERKSIKTVAFSKSKLVCSKATYAQVCNTIQHKKVIDSILNHNGGKLKNSIEMAKARSQGLVYILLYELLFGKYHSIRGGGKIKRSIMKFEKELNETKGIVVKDHDKKGCQSEIPVFPRYVRVNKLKATTEEVVKTLKKELESQTPDENGNNDIYKDAHVPDLLVMSPKVSMKWHESELVKSGKVILQDKSSCFSALALVHGRQYESNEQIVMGDFIDATAAPGNKTSHLASLIYDHMMTSRNQKNKKGKNNVSSKVFAFDRSSSRIAILRDRLSNLAPSVVSSDEELKRKRKKNDFPVDVCPRHEDFLKVDPQDGIYKNVRSILLDPSCSGSGIVNSPDRFVDATSSSDKEEKRIESLSNFQLVALKHAMSFPQCTRIVYSTCSVHQRENEDVVEAAMNETNEGIDDEDLKWELVPPMALHHWHRRGWDTDRLSKAQSGCLIRVNGMDGDETNGFFVSYFERRKISKQTSQSKPFSLVNLHSDGIKGIYNGEFRSKKSVEESNLTNSSKVKKDEKRVDTEKVTETKEVGTKDEEKHIPKKAGKKLLWKQKQKELKLARLKKKKLAAMNKE